MNRILVLTILLSFILSFGVKSNEDRESNENIIVKEDSVYPFSKYTYAVYINAYVDSLIVIDTSLDFIHQYDPVNKTKTFYRNTGSFGSANFPLFLETKSDIDFHIGFRMLDYYLFTPENTRYFDTRTPFTQTNYVQGTGELQLMSIFHTQNIKPNWNAGMKLERWRSSGSYFNQEILHTRLNFNTHYHSVNKRYRFLLSINTNNLFNDENGGITSLDAFNSLPSANKTAVNVMLNDAKFEFRNRSIAIRNQYYFGPSFKDTIYTETDTFITILKEPVFSFSLDNRYMVNKYSYEDHNPNHNKYPFTFFDDSYTYDSIRYNEFRNKLAINIHNLNIGESKIKPLNITGGIKHSISKITSGLYILGPFTEIDSLFQNTSIFYSINTGIYKVNIFSEGTFNFKGNLTNNFYFNSTLESNLNEHHKAGIFGLIKNKAPDFIFNRFLNNHFYWSHKFENTLTKKLNINYNYKNKIYLESGYTTIENYVYFNEFALPQQSETDIEYYSFKIKNHLKPGNFNFITALLFQREINTDIIRIPEFIINSNINYQTDMFKGALNAQYGIDISWLSSFRSGIYMPLLGNLYQQNDLLIGNYPYIDIYFNAKVKRVRFFVKIEHLNQGLWLNDEYFNITYYPQPPRSFRFGVNWIFYD